MSGLKRNQRRQRRVIALLRIKKDQIALLSDLTQELLRLQAEKAKIYECLTQLDEREM